MNISNRKLMTILGLALIVLIGSPFLMGMWGSSGMMASGMMHTPTMMGSGMMANSNMAGMMGTSMHSGQMTLMMVVSTLRTLAWIATIFVALVLVVRTFQKNTADQTAAQ